MPAKIRVAQRKTFTGLLSVVLESCCPAQVSRPLTGFNFNEQAGKYSTVSSSNGSTARAWLNRRNSETGSPFVYAQA